MRVIPVIDLLQGQVVRGVAGRRNEYRPLRSSLCSDADPRSVAQSLQEKLQLQTLYVADLDAILDDCPNWKAYTAMASQGWDLWVDAGLKNLQQTQQLSAFLKEIAGQGSIIAGLETVSSPAMLQEMLALVGPERLIFSLDLKQGQPLTQSEDWLQHSPEQILQTAVNLGVRRFIVLDLAQVGMSGGVGTEGLCRALRAMSAAAEIIAGGGVRGVEDLRALELAGCNAALVASALHDGRLGAEELAEFHC